MKNIVALFVFCIVLTLENCAQKPAGWKVDKMPPDLEMEYALSALPKHLRDQATVYLLDPEKGYYIGQQGTNGFSTFINRTEWEWAEFSTETYAAISYDAEGTKCALPVFLDVAKMRASGKYRPEEIRDTIVQRVKDGRYRAPSRNGISYMLSPILRTHPGTKEIVTQVMPHYMFYAPNVSNEEVGGVWNNENPFVIDSNNLLDKAKGYAIFNYIIIPAGETEKARIIKENEKLLRRLGEHKASLKMPAVTVHGHSGN